MKKTELYNIHVKLGAKMAQFAGFEMPIQYTSIIDEHVNVRKKIGVFDVSHMGEFYVEGDNSEKFLQYVCSNDISKLKVGKAQYNYFPNSSGGVMDDLIVYKLDYNRYLLVVNASNIQKDWDWLQEQNSKFKAELTDMSEMINLLSVQGPQTLNAMQSLTSFDLKSLSNYSHVKTDFADIKNVIISTTGYTGSGGIEIYIPKSHAEKIWNEVINAGKKYGIKPIGLAARDTLRIEMGFCLYGNEIDENTSPISAGLAWITKTETNFINSSSLFDQIKNGTRQKLVGLIIEEKGIPRTGYDVLSLDNKIIGKITSGTISPVISKGIGLAYINFELASVNSLVKVRIRNKELKAKIVDLPFVKL
jgi:aminomethyltransferase